MLGPLLHALNPRATHGDPHSTEAQSTSGWVNKHSCINKCFPRAQDCTRHFEKLQRSAGPFVALKVLTIAWQGCVQLEIAAKTQEYEI